MMAAEVEVPEEYRRRNRPAWCGPASTTAASPSSRTRREDAFIVRGETRHWVRQTNFDSEAVGYLADRLAKLGVEELAKGRKAGQPGHDRRHDFRLEPSTPAGVAGVLGSRGTTALENATAYSAAGRKAARQARRSSLDEARRVAGSEEEDDDGGEQRHQ